MIFPMNKPVLLIGGNGFVGKALTQALLRFGTSVVIASRRPAPAQLPENVRWVSCNVHSDQELETLFSQNGPFGAVVNLVGILHGKPGTPYGSDFLKAHVELPQRLIQRLSQQGPSRFIHISALGADSAGPSMYLRSKGDAEQLIMNSSLDWTILRPSVIFGEEDNFINMFAKLTALLRVFPLAGAEALMQPVSVEDVADCIVKSLQMPQTIHQRYDLAGPGVYTLSQLVKFSARKAGRKVWVVPLPMSVGKLQAALMELMPNPLISRDNLDSLKLDSTLPTGTSNAILSVFGITPTPLESLLS
jgi:NADH dehydrogenase